MRIDHLVWYNADLAQGRDFFARQLGMAPLYGGEHPGEGTANAVLSLGPSTYLEILGRDVNQGEEGLEPEVAALRGMGLYHWAVGGIDIAVVSRRAAKAGLKGGSPVPGGRLKPDGKRLDWICWGLRGHGFGSLIPFLIDWRDSDHPALSAPRGGRISAFEVQTPQAARLREIYGVLGVDVPVVEAPVSQVSVSLDSPAGSVKLTSFAPLPRGYVI